MAIKSCFDITTPRDFFNKVVLPQYSDYRANIASQRHALLSAIVTYHMYEWVHERKFTKEHFESTYPEHLHLIDNFETARKIANGTKHFGSPVETRSQDAFAEFIQAFPPGAWKENSWAHPLMVQFPNGPERPFDLVLHEMITFWEEQDPAKR